MSLTPHKDKDDKYVYPGAERRKQLASIKVGNKLRQLEMLEKMGMLDETQKGQLAAMRLMQSGGVNIKQVALDEGDYSDGAPPG